MTSAFIRGGRVSFPLPSFPAAENTPELLASGWQPRINPIIGELCTGLVLQPVDKSVSAPGVDSDVSAPGSPIWSGAGWVKNQRDV